MQHLPAVLELVLKVYATLGLMAVGAALMAGGPPTAARAARACFVAPLAFAFAHACAALVMIVRATWLLLWRFIVQPIAAELLFLLRALLLPVARELLHWLRWLGARRNR